MTPSVPTQPLDFYHTAVKVARDVQHCLQQEQARRMLATGQKISMHELASELLTKAALELAQ